MARLKSEAAMEKLPSGYAVETSIFRGASEAPIQSAPRQKVDALKSQLRSRPAVYAGIATAAGLALGLASRYMQDK